MNQKNFCSTRSAMAATLLAVAAVGSHAAATLCNTGVGDDNPLMNASGQSVSDVTYNGTHATNCYGRVSGNDSASDLNNLAAITGWGAGWALAARDNTDRGEKDESYTVAGMQWSVSATNTSRGTWVLTAQDVNGTAPANFGDVFDFVVGLKGGSGHAFYLFDKVVFDGFDDGGLYAITFRNGGGNITGLSHLSVYARYAGPGGDGGGSGGGRDPNAVALPGSLPLAAMGLALLTFIRRRA